MSELDMNIKQNRISQNYEVGAIMHQDEMDYYLKPMRIGFYCLYATKHFRSDE